MMSSSTTADVDGEVRKLLTAAGVPKTFHNARISDLAGDIYYETFRRSIMISGGSGTGKSYAAAAFLRAGAESEIADSLARTGNVTADCISVQSAWVLVPELLMRLRNSFCESSPQSEADIVASCILPEILVLDDLGAEKTSDYSLASLYVVLEKRLGDGKITLVTTNLSLSEIGQISPRIASRLSSFSQVVMNGKDRRIKEQKS